MPPGPWKVEPLAWQNAARMGRGLSRRLARGCGALRPDPVEQLQAALGDALGKHPSRTFAADSAVQLLLAIQAAQAAYPQAFDGPLAGWIVATADTTWRALAAWALAPESLECASWQVLLGSDDRRQLQQLVASLHEPPASPGDPAARPSPAAHLGAFVERLLTSWDGGLARSGRGVFFTPAPVAAAVVALVHDQLRRVLDCPAGLLDRSIGCSVAAEVRHRRPLTILDPACGAGVFLAATVDWCQQLFDRLTWADRDAAWNHFLESNLIPRLQGVELMLPSCALAHLNLAIHLEASGYRFGSPVGPRLRVGNSLRAATAAQLAQTSSGVVIGNPPFRALSSNVEPWIEDLLRGKEDGAPRWSSYYRFADDVLHERKHWLHDDYVKFLRLAHWLVERHGRGVVGLVTNHSYLDNVSFRILRRSLLHDFPWISVIDLHGNVKKGETAGGGAGRDASVFPIEQGVAISAFAKSSQAHEGAIRHADLWGPAEDKLQRLQHLAQDLAILDPEASDRLGNAACAPKQGSLASEPARAAAPGSHRQSLEFGTLQPIAPHFLLIPSDAAVWREYSTGVPLPELMPFYSTAPVTARDGLVVAFTAAELCDRLGRFCDLNIPDEVIRREMFSAARTQRYPAGDTRGWRLQQARRRLAGEDYAGSLRACLYRPFDQRAILWRPDMIDWPREPLVRTLDAGANWLLITRRRMLPHRESNFFWASPLVALDGVLRSDNRGSEAMFPMWIDDPDQPRRANFATQPLQRVTPQDRLRCVQQEPSRLAAYVYALFHSTTYRQRYAACLANEFPRIFAPSSSVLFDRLAHLGQQLLRVHLQPTALSAHNSRPSAADPCGQQVDASSPESWVVEKGFPRYRQSHVWINSRLSLGVIESAVWSFHVGAHQVCRKWLKDRQGRTLTAQDRMQYQHLVQSVARTLQMMRSIERAIEAAGGWREAFRLRPALG